MAQEIDLTKVASMLASTMCNAGIQDDYDEVLAYVFESSVQDATRYHDEVIEACKFIQEHGTDSDKDGYKPESYQPEFDEQLKENS